MTKNALKISTISFAILVTISSCVLIRQKKFQTALKKSALVSQNFSESFKFNLSPWIIIKGNLNHTSVDQRFILDTGSPCTFSYKTKDSLGLSSKKFIRLGEYKADYGFCDAEIGNIHYKDLRYLIMDNYLFNGQKVSGLIGVNAMQNSIWEINFKDSTIVVSDTLTNFKNISNAYKTKFKPFSAQQTPVVKLLINGTDTINAFIDTGEPGFMELNSKFDINKVKKQNPENVKTCYGNLNQQGEKVKRDSIYERNYVRLNSLKLGDLELTSSIARGSSLYKGKNLIGLEFLKKFIVTIDWRHYDLYLKPIESPVVPPKMFSYGFECYKIGGVLKVTDIFKGSLAEQSGIKFGDEILKINNQDVKNIDKTILKGINDDFPCDLEIVITFKNKDKNITLKKVSLF